MCLCDSIIQLLLSLVFQLVLMRHLEKLLGSLRICIIYVVCGIAGSLGSAIFIPYHVEVSYTAVIFGMSNSYWFSKSLLVLPACVWVYRLAFTNYAHIIWLTTVQKLSVCVCVCVLTRVVQVITTAHRDL